MGSGPGEFNEPFGVAVDDRGKVFVADTFNERVQKFAPVPVPVRPTTWGRLKTLYR